MTYDVFSGMLNLTQSIGMNYTCLYSPATERYRTLAGTHFPSCWG